MNEKPNLDDYLKYFGFNLYELDECVILIESIAKHSSELNKTGYKLAFGSIQSILYIHSMLNLSKLFDKPNAKYPTVSILSIISILKSPDLHTPGNVQKCLSMMKEYKITIPENDIQSIDLLIKHFTLLVEEKAGIIDKIKKNRDKVIAHNEAIELKDLDSITWGELLELKSLAEEFNNCIGYCFCGKTYIYGRPISDLGFLEMSIDTLIETALDPRSNKT